MLLLAQASLTAYFIQQLQNASQDISFHIQARDLGLMAIDELGSAVVPLQSMQEAENPASHLGVLAVYQEEISHKGDSILTTLQRLGGYDDSVETLKNSLSKFQQDYQTFQGKAGSNEQLVEQAFFLEDSLADLKNFLVKLDVRLRKGLDVAIEKEHIIHNRPMEASWIICAIAAVILIGSAWQFSRSLIGPIQRLAKQLTHMADGDLRDEPLNISGKDELAQLGQSMDKMTLNLRTVIAQVGKATSRLEGAATQVSRISEKMNQDITEQQSQTQQAATAMEEMSTTSRQVADHAAQATSSTKFAAEEATNGSQIVTQSIGTIHALANEVIRAGESIESLAAVSNNINTVIDVINEIADQTNLLALNAAIEAARAGEQGRGFAVVADEVRSLATRTERSTREIKDMIKELQTGAGEAVKVMVDGQSQAKASVEHASKAEVTLGSITEAVTRIHEVNIAISQATNDQRFAADELSKNLTTISQISDETSHEAKRTHEANVELRGLAGQLKELVSQFKV